MTGSWKAGAQCDRKLCNYKGTLCCKPQHKCVNNFRSISLRERSTHASRLDWRATKLQLSSGAN